jgi:hypothetical protein
MRRVFLLALIILSSHACVSGGGSSPDSAVSGDASGPSGDSAPEGGTGAWADSEDSQDSESLPDSAPGGDGDSEDSEDTQADGAEAGDADLEDSSDAGPEFEGPGIVGILVDELGNPLEDTKVLACQAKTCLYGESGPGGRFEFTVEPPAYIALKTLGNLSATPRQGAALEPLEHLEHGVIDCGHVYVPHLPEGAVVGPASADPQTLDVGDGLVLTLSRSALKLAPGELLTDVAARAIPEAQLPPIPGLDPAQIVAVYALHPFSAKSSTPIAVSAPSNLPAGTPVEFRTIGSLDGLLSEPVPGAADGTSVTTAEGQGIAELTRVVISLPE